MLVILNKCDSFSHRAPSPTKRSERSEDKPKERGKEKAAGKEGAEKERGRDKIRKRRSKSTGSSSRSDGMEFRVYVCVIL